MTALLTDIPSTTRLLATQAQGGYGREVVGYLASSLVLATFCVRQMMPLRAIAILSNCAFISYALMADVRPVLVLHLVLLPTNLIRLSQLLEERGRARRERRGQSLLGDERPDTGLQQQLPFRGLYAWKTARMAGHHGRRGWSAPHE